jgi:hypothetical protein
MIVRDEEENLTAALDSIHKHVDEIVIVDTGSTDATVEIAKLYTDKVYIHPWQDDFSHHRNQSLEYCSGDWIIYIDADEKLDSASGPRLKSLIKEQVAEHPDIDAMMLHLINWTKAGENMGSCNLVRCFRNDPGIRFRNRVHNNLSGFGAVCVTDLVIHHYGYDHSPERKRDKFIRTTRLLKKMLAEDPEDPVPMHYMAISSHTLDDVEEVGYWSAKCFEAQEKRKRCGPQLRGWGYYMSEISALRGNRLDDFWGYFDKAIQEDPQHLDSYALAANAAFLAQDWAKCVEYVDKYVEVWNIAAKEPQKLGLQALNTQKQRWKIEWQGACASIESGRDLVDAFQRFSRAVHHAPNQAEAMREVGRVLSATEARPDGS